MTPLDPTVLVVEDTQSQGSVARLALHRSCPGIDVHVAGDGREGLAYLGAVPPFQDRGAHPFPDLVIVDLDMRDASGFGVLQRARDLRADWPFSVVVLGSRLSPRTREQALALGAEACFEKPIDVDEMGSLMGRIVQLWLGATLPRRVPPTSRLQDLARKLADRSAWQFGELLGSLIA